MTYEHSQEPACGNNSALPSVSHRPFILDRWQVLSAVKSVARALNLGEREITVLTAHLSVLAKGPVRSDQVLISWAGLPALLERANCMDERRFRRGETRLEKAGLIRRKLSGNSRRYPVRNGKGVVIDAYGIDLRPLFDVLPYLLELKARLDEEKAQIDAIRSQISAGLSQARRSIAETGNAIPEWLEQLMTTARNALRRKGLTIAEAKAVREQVTKQLSQSTPTVENPMVPDTTTGDAGHNVRHSESPKKEIYLVGSVSALWRSAPHLQEFFAEEPSDHRDLTFKLLTMGKYLGLSNEVCTELVRHLKLQRLVRLTDYLVEKVAQIANPEKYVKSLLAKIKAGDDLHLFHDCSSYDRGHNYIGF